MYFASIWWMLFPCLHPSATQDACGLPALMAALPPDTRMCFMVFARHVLHLITSYQVSPCISAAGTVTVSRRTDSDSIRMLHKHAHLFYTGFLHSAVRLQEESSGAEGLYSDWIRLVFREVWHEELTKVMKYLTKWHDGQAFDRLCVYRRTLQQFTRQTFLHIRRSPIQKKRS